MSKKTCDAICRSGNDYVIAVKNNRPHLIAAIRQAMDNKDNPSSQWIECEDNKGRSELRCVKVVNVDQLHSRLTAGWNTIRQFISVERICRTTSGKYRHQHACFISSANGNAFFYAAGIRSHWNIENRLHYVKDVTFREDASKVRLGNGPVNYSLLRSMAINLLRLHEGDSCCFAQAIRRLANDIKALKKILN